MSEEKETPQQIRWRGAIWGLAISTQGALMVAFPVLGGLALGYWLDLKFGTLPWITLVMTLIGASVGPFILFQWVKKVVKNRRERMEEREEEKF